MTFIIDNRVSKMLVTVVDRIFNSFGQSEGQADYVSGIILQVPNQNFWICMQCSAC